MQRNTEKLDVFPAFFKVADRNVVIVGGGDEAASKLRLLSETSANLSVISPNPSLKIQELAGQVGAQVLQREFTFEDLADAALVFTAQKTAEADQLVVEAARMVGVPVNAVDRPEICDFITPSIVNRAPVVVAISTNGTAPVLARRLKAAVEKLLPSDTGLLARSAGKLREKVEEAGLKGREKRLFWERFFDGSAARFALKDDSKSVSAVANNLFDAVRKSSGSVALIGAGPGCEDLLTLRAHKLLQDADVVVHDALVPLEIVRMSRRDAEIIAVRNGKDRPCKTQNEISHLLVSKAKQGLKIVRLKAGDPMLFGRAAEEVAALRTADLTYEVVPGVTASLTEAAEAGIPLTPHGTAADSRPDKTAPLPTEKSNSLFKKGLAA